MAPLCCITVLFDAQVVQGRYSSVVPQGSLPAFEIAFQTFCLGLWQDTSLSLTAITALLQPAGTPLNEAKSLSDIQCFSLLLRGLQLSEQWRGWRQSGREALCVSSGPILSQVTYCARINWTFLNSYTFKFPPFKKNSDCLRESDGTSVSKIYEFISHSVADQLLLKAAVSKLWWI